MALELSDKSWNLALGDGARGPSRYPVAAGDKGAVLDRITKAKARCGLPQEAKVHSCYEAGRDGFWLHRWLIEQDIDNIVVDSSSIEVNRRARRAKTDRLDADKLLTMLLRYQAGERRTHRELERLRHERTAHSNRIGSLLVLHNLRVKHIGGRDWKQWWESHMAQVPPSLRAEIERERVRLALTKDQIQAIEAEQRKEVVAGEQLEVAQLSRMRAIGLRSAWVLIKELFGWRHFNNRREVAGCLGLAPTPYASGESHKASTRPATSDLVR